VPFFFKQWGGRHHAAGGRLLDGRTWDELPPDRPLPHRQETLPTLHLLSEATRQGDQQ